ncbi:MAG: tyrosine--tRNA ligase [Thermoplasmatales archaeon]|nr:tyrosine--tRNA ligase [Thermoplasmatales archaeon]MCW6170198.1 tyrosine--tRNA ligase [Thermoplasmatales archaeon]
MLSLETFSGNMAEIITPEEFNNLSGKKVTAYCGFEPSGIPHIAIGLMWPKKFNEVSGMGIDLTILLADWHAMINDKLGGDLEAIRKSGEQIRKSMLAVGLSDKIKFTWAKDLVSDPDYWEMFLRVAKASSLTRLRRSLPIMGRTEDEADKDFSKYIYPIMQVTDIFYLDVDIALGGMDQRHAHMLARDVADKLRKKKVVCAHAPLMGSLKGSGRMDTFVKMSKSDPGAAILMSDSLQEISEKMKKAFCPMKQKENNPVLDIFHYIIFPWNSTVTIERPIGKGGDISFGTFSELEKEYSEGNIHPIDLKEAATISLDKLVAPARKVLLADSGQ